MNSGKFRRGHMITCTNVVAVRRALLPKRLSCAIILCPSPLRRLLKRGLQIPFGISPPSIAPQANERPPYAIPPERTESRTKPSPGSAYLPTVRSCERIGGGEGPLSRSTVVLRVLSTAAVIDYGHDMRFPFLGWGSRPLRPSISLRLGLGSGGPSSGGGTIAEYCK